MHFRTEINISLLQQPFNYATTFMLLGSCFTENMGNLMNNLQFNTCINPFGIVYNPISIANCLQNLLNYQPFTLNNLLYYNQQWCSLQHHGSFSDISADACLQKINNSLLNATNYLKNTKVLIITLGTAFVYRDIKRGSVVANCHKMPANNFNYSMLKIDEILNEFNPILQQLIHSNNNLQIIFTLSPIRHWKDGAANNSLSKATLRVAINELLNEFKLNTHYFPAFELATDDLRDYRFYANDMLHLSDVAIEYIWKKFIQAYFSSETLLIMDKVNSINKIFNHKTQNPTSEIHKQLINKQQQNIKKLVEQYPFLCFEKQLKNWLNN